MSRAKSSVSRKKRVKAVLKRTKGFYGKKKNLISVAKQTLMRADMFAFAHRRKKKGDFRRLWITRINAGLEAFEIKYSRFMHALQKSDIRLNRKSLSYLAFKDKEGFKKVVETTKKHL